MRRKAYSGRDVKQVNVEHMIHGREGQPVWVGVDIGKYELKIVVHWGPQQFERPWTVQNPFEVRQAVNTLRQLARGRTLVLAVEPSGTYGDPFRQAALDAGLAVHRVHPKVAHDYAEVFDGVPSQHDGKDAAVVAELARMGKSSPWPALHQEDCQQEMEYWVMHMDTHRRLLQMYSGRVEAGLARHWPEAAQVLKSSSSTLLRIFLEYGTPAAFAADSGAPARVRSWSRHLLQPESIQRLLESAAGTVGMRMSRWDVQRMRELAEAALAARREVKRCQRRLAQLAAENATLRGMGAAVGLTTACVLWVCLGDPHAYHCAEAYLKAMGLNLTERSSGTYQGRLRISKRGHGMVRYWMYLATMRLLKQGPVRRWFERKKRGDGQKGGKALVGVMRRLGLALWHVGACGEVFEVSRLFPGVKAGTKGR